jgi:hypothetical protein
MQPTCRPCRRRTYPTEEAATAVVVRNSTKFGKPYRAKQCPFGDGWHVCAQTPVLGEDQLMTRADVAAAFRVVPPSVVRWEKAGHLTPIRTLGGQVRYRESEVEALYRAGWQPATGGAA